jgi:hypothetical protein
VTQIVEPPYHISVIVSSLKLGETGVAKSKGTASFDRRQDHFRDDDARGSAMRDHQNVTGQGLNLIQKWSHSVPNVDKRFSAWRSNFRRVKPGVLTQIAKGGVKIGKVSPLPFSKTALA